MRKLIKYDLYRAFRQPSTWVLLSITLIVSIVSALDATVFSEETGGLAANFGNALAAGRDIMLLLSGCVCALLIGEDFSIGAYGLAVSSGCGRRQILCGRTLSCFIVIALMLAEYMLVSFALSAICADAFTAGEAVRLLALACLHAVHFCAMNATCVLACFVLKKKVNATAVCLFLNVLLLALTGLVCSKSDALGALYLKSVPVLSYTMFLGGESALTVLGSTLVHLLFAAALLFAAGRIFAKEELV